MNRREDSLWRIELVEVQSRHCCTIRLDQIRGSSLGLAHAAAAVKSRQKILSFPDLIGMVGSKLTCDSAGGC